MILQSVWKSGPFLIFRIGARLSHGVAQDLSIRLFFEFATEFGVPTDGCAFMNTSFPLPPFNYLTTPAHFFWGGLTGFGFLW